MRKKINFILNAVLEKVKSSEKELKEIESLLGVFLEKFKKNLKSLKIDAEVFVGGSFAKKTVIKKGAYDIDVFVRFGKKSYEKNVSDLVSMALRNFKNVLRIHGSRDYFQVKINPSLFIEIVPVKKIKNLKEADNITDLSYSHVKYINKKIKSQRILDEIKITKAFCYANGCYGAESYIKGFSGYSLELLIYFYGSFIRFIKEMSKVKKDEKVVVDIERHFRNKNIVLMDLNSAKLNSPVIVIDPTYKSRNALAALSEETFYKFKEDCKKFLKTPSVKFFEEKKIDLNKIKLDAKKKSYEFVLLEAKTDKQEGDVAGSKLIKFYRHLCSETEKLYEIKNCGFNYNNKKSARYFFVVKNKKEVVLEGPKIDDLKNISKFKKKHGKTFIKKGRIHAKNKIKLQIKEFVNVWKKKNSQKLKEMSIINLKVI